MAKINFQQALLQSAVSLDPSDILLICFFAAELWSIIISAQLLLMFLLIVNVNTLLLDISVETVFQDTLMQDQNVFEIFCNIINVLTVTNDQFNVFMWRIYFFTELEKPLNGGVYICIVGNYVCLKCCGRNVSFWFTCIHME